MDFFGVVLVLVGLFSLGTFHHSHVFNFLGGVDGGEDDLEGCEDDLEGCGEDLESCEEDLEGCDEDRCEEGDEDSSDVGEERYSAELLDTI